MKLKQNKPFSVYYTGASAGCFFALTLALASQNTHSISSTKTIQDIIKKNWNIQNVEDWDDYQVKYDYSYDPGVGLYDKKMPLMPDGKYPIIKYDQALRIVNDGSISILPYTDIDTHYELMRLKRRAYFHKDNTFDFTGYAIERYNMVKDKSWPDIQQLADLELLPNYILNELINDFNFPNKPYILSSWENQFKINNSFEYNNIRIFKRHIDHIFNKVDYKFLLQDVIKTKFKCVTDILELDHTQEVIDHVNLWVSLHPKYIQEMFYKDI